MILICFQESPGSNLDLEVDYPEVDSGVFSSPGKILVITLSQATTTSFHGISVFFFSIIPTSALLAVLCTTRCAKYASQCNLRWMT
jgi:hypothetical protein